jgi:hypothetical protein
MRVAAMLAVATLLAWASISDQRVHAQAPAAPQPRTDQPGKPRTANLKDGDWLTLADISEAHLRALFAAVKEGDKVGALLKDQYQAARKEAEMRWANMLAGRGSLDLTLSVFQRMLQVELDLSRSKADRVAALEAQWQRTLDIEGLNQARFNAGRINMEDLQQSRFHRVRAEIMLERAKAGRP